MWLKRVSNYLMFSSKIFIVPSALFGFETLNMLTSTVGTVVAGDSESVDDGPFDGQNPPNVNGKYVDRHNQYYFLYKLIARAVILDSAHVSLSKPLLRQLMEMIPVFVSRKHLYKGRSVNQ